MSEQPQGLTIAQQRIRELAAEQADQTPQEPDITEQVAELTDRVNALEHSADPAEA